MINLGNVRLINKEWVLACILKEMVIETTIYKASVKLKILKVTSTLQKSSYNFFCPNPIILDFNMLCYIKFEFENYQI